MKSGTPEDEITDSEEDLCVGVVGVGVGVVVAAAAAAADDDDFVVSPSTLSAECRIPIKEPP